MVAGVVADDDVFDFHPKGKNAQLHLSQLYGTIEPLLQLGLYLPTILVDVNQVEECKHNDDYDGNEDNGNDR